MLGRICIINAPLVFRGVWQLIKPLLNPRTLSKIQVRAGRVCAGDGDSPRRHLAPPT
jgi:hypothetical protein